MADDARGSCYSCDQQDRLPWLPPREDVLHTSHWRVAHAFNSTLPGWLVVLPTEHLTAFADLSEDAAGELGPLLRSLSRALETVTGCVKTYAMQFAEAEGFSHLHLHLVPRAEDHPPDRRGPAVFGYLTPDRSQWLPEHVRDDLARQVRAAAGRPPACPSGCADH